MTAARGSIGAARLFLRQGVLAGSVAMCAFLLAGCPQLQPGGGQEPTGPAPDGAALYESLSCMSCHGSDACGDVGPAVHDVTFDQLDAFVRDSASPHLGGTHPDLTDDELQALADYLGSLEDCPKTELTAAPQRPQYADLSVIGLHDPSSDAYRADCVRCHSDRLSEGAPFGEIPAAHSVMKRLLGHARCRTCHSQGVDIVFRSTARLRAEMFDKVSCASSRCHGASGALPFYATDD